MANKYNQWKAEKRWKAKMNLLSKIHKVTDKIVAAQDAAWNSCDGRTRGIEFQFYTNEKGCSHLKTLGFGYMMPDMTANNSIGHRLLGQ